jgi:hypothetical protein
MDIVEKEQEQDTLNLNNDMSLFSSIDEEYINEKSMMKINKSLISNISNITHFHLVNLKNGLNLSDIDCILLRDALIKNTSVISIHISWCKISDIQAIILSEIINSDYINNGKGNKTIISFTIVFKNKKKLISKIGIKALLQALNNNNFIEEFVIHNNDSNDHICNIKELDLITNIIETNDKLLHFDISSIIDFSKYDDDDDDNDDDDNDDDDNDDDSIVNEIIILNSFSNSIKNNKTLLSLNLNNCNVNKIILNGIQNNSTLQRVYLDEHYFDDNELKALADILKFNKTLEYISLDECFDIIKFKKLIEEGLQDSTLEGIYIDLRDSELLYVDLDNWYSDDIYIDESTGTLINDIYVESILNLLSKCKNIYCESFTSLFNIISKHPFNTNYNRTKILEKYKNIMENNNNLYINTFWNPWEHLLFKNIERYDDTQCHQLVMATLVCNSYLKTKLSIYLWQYIFSFYQKKQFLSR